MLTQTALPQLAAVLQLAVLLQLAALQLSPEAKRVRFQAAALSTG